MTTEDFYHTIIPLRDDLLRYAVSLTASSDDADDLAQETLLRLWDMRNATLKGYKLNIYKSLVYKHLADDVAPYLQADRKRAKKIREVVEDGLVTGGYYMMQPTTEGLNRYILFSNGAGQRGTVIYIEGRLSPDDIMTLCYSRRK